MKFSVKMSGILSLTACSLFLMGCGGGGGSSSGSKQNTTISYNAYLPLIPGTGWRNFSNSEGGNSIEATVSSTNEISGASTPVFKFNASSASSDLGAVELFYASTPAEVGFWGMKGSIPIDVPGLPNARINSILFDRAIPYWRDNFRGTTSVDIPAFTARVATNVQGVSNLNVEVSDGKVNYNGTVVITTGYGDLVAERVRVTFSGTAAVPFVGSINVDYDDVIVFAKGIGIVSRETTIDTVGGGIVIAQQLQSVIGLPEPMRFEQVQGQAVLATDDDTIRLTGGASLSSSTFNLINQGIPNWFSVDAAAGNVFTIKATGATSPQAPRAEVVYFSRSSGAPLPMNVSLVNP